MRTNNGRASTPSSLFRSQQQRIKLSLQDVSDLEIAYTDVGTGAPLLLLHGIPTWSYLYASVIDELAKHYRVVAPDFIGHGYSDHRDQFDRSLEAQAEMIKAFLRELALPRVHLAAHDTGGGVALILAIRHPELLDHLILSNIVAYDSWPIDDMIALGNPRWSRKSIAEIRGFLCEGFAEGLYNQDKLTEDFMEGITAPYLTETGKISLIRNASALNTNHTTQLVASHTRIKAPTLLLWGVDDPWQTITDGRRLLADIPNAQLVELVDTSHWLQQDNPVAYTEHLLEFLPRS